MEAVNRRDALKVGIAALIFPSLCECQLGLIGGPTGVSVSFGEDCDESTSVMSCCSCRGAIAGDGVHCPCAMHRLGLPLPKVFIQHLELPLPTEPLPRAMIQP